MNTELLLRVKKHILQKPTRLRMSSWLCSKGEREIIGGKFIFGEPGWGEPDKQTVPSCGTVGCIAGWTVMLAGDKDAIESKKKQATRLLDLEDYSSEKLFYVTSWPSKLQDAYMHSKNQRERAKIVGQVIDLFIKTKGTFIEQEIVNA